MTQEERGTLLALLMKAKHELEENEVADIHPIFQAHSLVYAHHKATAELYRRTGN